ncbi:DUF6428 family protein [Gangjinia marincola]|uniref:DUF6428 family protein n=1 Tax=Gangjinia marincola TaxID=578463 RepID=A0ABP3XUL0_9FLAO
MSTREFLDLLKEHQGKSLLFEYQPNLYVGANYHITEIKNTRIDAVNCGGEAEQWNETIIQLWESPEDKETNTHMTAYKALGILTKVDQIRTMDRNAEVKFEYSNADFHTSIMPVQKIASAEGKLIIQLHTKATDCKAKEACGIPEATLQAENACAPGSGCC